MRARGLGYRGGSQAGYTHACHRRPYMYKGGFGNIIEDKHKNKFGDVEDDGNNSDDSTTNELEEALAQPFDLTKNNDRSVQTFIHRNAHPHQQRAFKPRRLGRGRATAILVENDFKFSKGNDKLWVEKNETRVWVSNSDIGMIIGYRRERQERLQDKYNVIIKIPRAPDEDRYIGVIIEDENEDNRNGCKLEIEQILSGVYRDPPDNEDDEIVEDESSSAHQNHKSNGPVMGSVAPGGENTVELDDSGQLILKTLYICQPSVSERLSEEVKTWRLENNKVTIRSLSSRDKNPDEGHINNPCLTFEEAFIRFPDILEKLKEQNFPRPTPIQSQFWPLALQGRDCIGISQTGSGKTLSFVAPLVAHIKYGGFMNSLPKEEEETGDSECFTRRPDVSTKKPIYECEGPLALILAPTRELAEQIRVEIDRVFRGFMITDDENQGDYRTRLMKSLVVVGGQSKRNQIESLSSEKEKPHIIVGTPGRIIDLAYENSDLNLESVTFVVFDEADRMLDMGFEPQIKKIVNLCKISKNRQTLMTSATWPVEVQTLAKKYMKSPIITRVGEFDLKCVDTISQTIIKVTSDTEKLKHLIRTLTDLREVYNPEEDEEEQTYEDDEDGEQQLIEAEPEEIPVQIPVEQPQRFGSPERPPNAETGWGDNSSNGSGGWQEEIQAADFSNFNTPELVKHSYKMIIFCSMKLTVDDVYSKLSQEPSIRKYTCKMHGDIDQQFRDAALRDFKSGRCNILVATDVAGRGLDVEDVTHVFNYDMPENMDDYVHRIGRTGRAGRTGVAITIFNVKDPRDENKADELLELVMQSKTPTSDLKWLERLAKKVKSKKEMDKATGKTYRRSRRY